MKKPFIISISGLSGRGETTTEGGVMDIWRLGLPICVLPKELLTK